MTGTLTKAGERYLAEFAEALFVQPWWWQATGRTQEDWDNHLRVTNGTCRHVIHDQPIYCERVLTKTEAPNVFVCPEGHFNWLNGFTWAAFHRDRTCTMPAGHDPHIWLYRQAPNYPDLQPVVDWLFRCDGSGPTPHSIPIEFEGH